MPMGPRTVILALSLFFATVKGGRPSLGTKFNDLPYLDKTSDKEAIILHQGDYPPEYAPAINEDEWESFLRDNLEEDLYRFRRRVQQDGPLSVARLAIQMVTLVISKQRKHMAFVVIRQNRIYRYLPRGMDSLLRHRVNDTLHTLSTVSARLGLNLPDTVFIINVYDTPVCRELARGCQVPIFTCHKRYDDVAKESVDSELLMPHMGHNYDRLIFYPWRSKNPRALLRATLQNTMSTSCARMQLANLSAVTANEPLLDCGFIANRKHGFKMPKEFMKDYVGMVRHSEYKFLVNADGHVSSSRLGHIMQTNSVILKQRSPWIEYYYRSLKHGEHILEYTPQTIVPLLRKYSDPERDEELRRIANASQHFVAKYLTTESKVRYAVRALEEYTRLFSGLSTFVDGFSGGLQGGAPRSAQCFIPGKVLLQPLVRGMLHHWRGTGRKET